MGVSSFIARRYLFSKKSKNAINYITGVSVVLVAFVTMSLIIAMSVFNGLTILITSLFNSFDPDIRISSADGRVFSADSAYVALAKHKDIYAYTPVLEDDVLFVYAEKQLVGKLKGVGSEYKKTCSVDSMLVAGEFVLQQEGVEYVTVGQGIAHNLAVGLQFKDVLQIYAPERGKQASSINPMEDFRKEYVYPRGVFAVQIDIDDKYVISSIDIARKLFEYKHNEVSSIEVKCINTSDMNRVANDLQSLLGANYIVKDREQQHEFLYKITQSEKLITFLIVTLILIIASFSIVGALTMLIIDKKRDISILTSMGAGQKLIKRIFIFEGWMISVAGAVIGVCVGLMVSYVQQYFGLLKLGNSESFLVEAYPVKVQIVDVLYVMGMVLTVGFLTAYIPVNYIIKKHIR